MHSPQAEPVAHPNAAVAPTPQVGPDLAHMAGGALPLRDWGLIRAEGADAASFLHGQLTQDVTHLAPGQARLAGYCSAKGRLLASFVLWSEPATPGSAAALWLACSADLLAPTLKRLKMFVLRAKCTLRDASADRPLWGLAGAAAQAALGDAANAAVWSTTPHAGGTLLRLPDALVDGRLIPRWLWAAPDAHATPCPGLPAMADEHWRGLEACSGVARTVAATAEQFVPQMVNLELVGGVNFQKGCYPGQEVVARSQYRGTLKRRAQLLWAPAGVALAPGQELFHSADPGQPAGMAVLSGVLPAAPGGRAERPVVLAELKLAALDGGTVHLGSADGPPLCVGTLPYTLSHGVD